MNTLLTPLLARLTSATGVGFTVNTAGDIVVAAEDAFKLAALVDLAQNPEPPPTQEEIMHERVYYGLDTVMGRSVVKDLADKRAATEREKLAEAGRKSWVTRRANAAKKGGAK